MSLVKLMNFVFTQRVLKKTLLPAKLQQQCAEQHMPHIFSKESKFQAQTDNLSKNLILAHLQWPSTDFNNKTTPGIQ